MPAGARVAVLRGAGKVFCAGADLTWMSKMVGYSREENVRDAMAMADDVPGARHAAAAAHRPDPRRGARRRRRARRRLRHRRRRRRRGVRVHRGEARDPAGGDLAVRGREDRRVGGARAVPDRARASRPAARGRSGWCTRSCPRPTSTRPSTATSRADDRRRPGPSPRPKR